MSVSLFLSIGGYAAKKEVEQSKFERLIDLPSNVQHKGDAKERKKQK